MLFISSQGEKPDVDCNPITAEAGFPDPGAVSAHDALGSEEPKPAPAGASIGAPAVAPFASGAVAKPLMILSEVRFLREGIAGAIEQGSQFFNAGLCENLKQVFSIVRNHPAPTVILDASFPNGLEAVREIRAVSPAAQVVVFAMSETQENVIAWAKAGAAGYIPTSVGLDEFVRFVEAITRGEQICSAKIVSGLMRFVGSSAREHSDLRLAMSLTVREREITRMIAEGLSNKEIARKLKIELSTTKSHVHNLLGKLGLSGRNRIAHWALTNDGWR